MEVQVDWLIHCRADTEVDLVVVSNALRLESHCCYTCATICDLARAFMDWPQPFILENETLLLFQLKQWLDPTLQQGLMEITELVKGHAGVTGSSSYLGEL